MEKNQRGVEEVEEIEEMQEEVEEMQKEVEEAEEEAPVEVTKPKDDDKTKADNYLTYGTAQGNRRIKLYDEAGKINPRYAYSPKAPPPTETEKDAITEILADAMTETEKDDITNKPEEDTRPMPTLQAWQQQPLQAWQGQHCRDLGRHHDITNKPEEDTRPRPTLQAWQQHRAEAKAKQWWLKKAPKEDNTSCTPPPEPQPASSYAVFPVRFGHWAGESPRAPPGLPAPAGFASTTNQRLLQADILNLCHRQIEEASSPAIPVKKTTSDVERTGTPTGAEHHLDAPPAPQPVKKTTSDVERTGTPTGAEHTLDALLAPLGLPEEPLLGLPEPDTRTTIMGVDHLPVPRADRWPPGLTPPGWTYSKESKVSIKNIEEDMKEAKVSIKNIEEDMKFIRNQTGHILNFLKLQSEQIHRQGAQLMLLELQIKEQQSEQMKEIISSLVHKPPVQQQEVEEVIPEVP